MKYNVSEIFLSVQGEGLRTGVPSIFVRSIGCTLRCCWKSQLTGEVSLCDTPYTSHNCEDPKYTTVDEVYDAITEILEMNPRVRDVVFTGGEPMIFQDAIRELIERLNDEYSLWYTLETNGTIGMTPVMNNLIDLISISPKLPSSGAFEGTNISKNDRLLHERNRFKPDALITYYEARNDLDVQTKFVASTEQDEKDIHKWIDELENTYNVRVRNVMLMPEGQRPEEITKSVENILPICIRNGWRLCDRLHVRIWGDKRGV